MENEKWKIDNSYAIRAGFKSARKNHPDEFGSCFNNLNKVREQLLNGHKIGTFKLGFFRSEGTGLYRVGQSGDSATKELRLYVYFYHDEKGVVYPLAMGTKESQQRDINEAKKIIGKIKQSNK